MHHKALLLLSLLLTLTTPSHSDDPLATYGTGTNSAPTPRASLNNEEIKKLTEELFRKPTQLAEKLNERFNTLFRRRPSIFAFEHYRSAEELRTTLWQIEQLIELDKELTSATSTAVEDMQAKLSRTIGGKQLTEKLKNKMPQSIFTARAKLLKSSRDTLEFMHTNWGKWKYDNKEERFRFSGSNNFQTYNKLIQELVKSEAEFSQAVQGFNKN